jgi:hypothetical protein
MRRNNIVGQRADILKAKGRIMKWAGTRTLLY